MYISRIAAGLATAVILRSESRGTHDHILLSQIRDSPNLEGQVPVFMSPRKRVARLYPQALGSFSSPPTTCGATVEVFNLASTRELQVGHFFSFRCPNTQLVGGERRRLGIMLSLPSLQAINSPQSLMLLLTLP
jgi:hypothetical protein